MTLPGSFNKVTVTGTYTTLTGELAKGKVTFTPDSKTWLTAVPEKVVIVPKTITADLTNGTFAVDLPATDDPDILPNGGTYVVTEVVGTDSRTYSIQVPVGSGPIDLATVAPVQPVTATSRLVTSVNGVKPNGAGNIVLTPASIGALELEKFDRFGSNLLIGDPSGSPTQAQTAASIATMASQFGPRPMLLVFHIAYDAGTLKIVQHGYGATAHSEAKVDAAVAALAGYNFPLYGIKVHQSGITSGQVTAQFWTDYTALINQLATKYQGRCPYFFVTNEFESATGNTANLAALNGLVSAVRGKGFKAGMIFNALPEASRCVVTDLDGIGVNVYPSVSTSGLDTTWQQVASAWDGYGVADYFRYVKRQYPGRDCFVTETGSTDKPYALEYTPHWDVHGQPDNAGQVVGRYWEGALRYLAGADGDPVDAVFAWDQGLFDPYQFPYSLNIMKRYAKAATL